MYFLAVIDFVLICACVALFWEMRELTARDGRRHAELLARIDELESCFDEAGIQALTEESEAEEKARKAADQYWEGLSNILSYEPTGKRDAE